MTAMDPANLPLTWSFGPRQTCPGYSFTTPTGGRGEFSGPDPTPGCYMHIVVCNSQNQCTQVMWVFGR